MHTHSPLAQPCSLTIPPPGPDTSIEEKQQTMVLALAACKGGEAATGARLCHEVLARDPEYFDALFLSGVIAAENGNLEAAADFLTRATRVNPESLTAHLRRAVTMQRLDRYAEALQSYDMVTAIDPAMAEAHNNRGVMLYKLERYEEAVSSHDNAIRLNPAFVDAQLNRGAALTRLGRCEEALSSYRACLALDTTDTRALSNCAVTLRELGRHAEALQMCARALSLQPDDAEYLLNLGNTLRDLGRNEDALLVYERAIALRENYTSAFYNRGNALKAMNRLESAIDSFAQAIRLQNDFIPAHWNSALCRLLLGDFDNGWPGYEWRWTEQSGINTPLSTTRPRWTPDCGARRLLIWPEQGVGDEIMFGCLLPEARRLAPELIVMLDTRLIPLFSRSMPDIRFVPKSPTFDENRYDTHLPIGSLCQYLRPNAEAFARTPRACLRADPVRSAALRAELQVPGKRLCGISWRSGGLKTGLERSLPLSELVAALDSLDLTLVNLQYGNVDAEIEAHNAAHRLQVQRCASVDVFNDLDGLAALVAACDEVISVDNTTVHLGGALGVPVSVLLPFHPDWRWQLKRTDSPWYPSLTLLRQHEPGNWSAPLLALNK